MQEIHASTGTSTPATPIPAHPRPLIPWIELVAGFFGFHGVGLFLGGLRTRGAIWFALSLVKHLVGAVIIAFTAGLALACLLPLDIVLSFYLAQVTARHLRKQEHAAATLATQPV